MEAPPSPSPCVTSTSGTRAASSPVATAIICSSEIWWRLGCIPSRRLMSWSVTFLPCSFIGSLSIELRLEHQSAVRHLVREHLRRAQRGGGHDVEVAGVFGQVIAEPLHLDEGRHAPTIENRSVLQGVTRYVLLHFFD